MNLSENLSKELLAQYGVAIPTGRMATTAEEAEARCREIDATRYVVKANIGAGGRGLAGGVKFAATPSSVRTEAAAMLGKPLVTEQTSASGEVVESVYIEAAVDIARSLFIALVMDPSTGAPTLLGSAKGGVEFEQMARMDPEVVSSLPLPPDEKEISGIGGFLQGLGLPEEASDQAVALIRSAVTAFFANDLTMLEINPLALTTSGECLALDAKITIDDNALFRHPQFETIRQRQGLTPAEAVAQENDINLVKLGGNIGVVVNGAGLGLVTNDMLVDAGGKPANFMDIRTTATSFQIAKGVGLLLEDEQVRAILLNVHGGGMTVCDTVAEGVALAYARSDRRPPLAVRFAGQNADYARKILDDRLLPVRHAGDMSTAVARVVEMSLTGEV